MTCIQGRLLVTGCKQGRKISCCVRKEKTKEQGDREPLSRLLGPYMSPCARAIAHSMTRSQPLLYNYCVAIAQLLHGDYIVITNRHITNRI